MVDPSGWLSYRAGFVQTESVMNILNFNMKFQLSVILDFLGLLAWNYFSLNFILTFHRYKPRAHDPTSSPGRFSLALEVGREKLRPTSKAREKRPGDEVAHDPEWARADLLFSREN